jgi:hypothetical protein
LQAKLPTVTCLFWEHAVSPLQEKPPTETAPVLSQQGLEPPLQDQLATTMLLVLSTQD